MFLPVVANSSSAIEQLTALLERATGLESWELWTILVGMIGNSACAIVGCFLVLRRMSMLGDAISHSVLAAVGVVLLLTGKAPFVLIFFGAMAVGMLTAFLTQGLTSLADVPEDSSMGVVFTSLFALGVVIISQFDVHLDADCVLFGKFDFVALTRTSVAGLRVPEAFLRLSCVLLLTTGTVMLLWKELKVASFDPALATAMGLNAHVIHYALMALVAAVTVTSLESVGAIVVIAMLIVPPATAHLLTDRMGRMLLLAILVGQLSAIGGYLGAKWLDANSAGMMAVVAGIQFALAVFLAPAHGLLAKALNTLRLRLRIVREDILARLYRAEESATGGVASGPSGLSREECDRFTGGGWRSWLALRLLQRSGEIVAEPDGLFRLTDAGRRSGRSLLRSHRLWESYISKHFELADDHLHEPAERVEHFIGPALQGELEQELAKPGLDPHGRQIPAAEEK